MRHNIITVAAVAASAILLTLSCTKQEEMQSVNKGKTFIATIEQAQTKTTLENNGDGKYFVNWNSGDLININAQAVYSAEPDSRKAGYAEFTFVKGQEPEPPYRAVYPADLYNSEDKSLYFPMVQQYEAGRCNAPMMAMGDEESLLFHNICGVICFSLTGTDRVRGIELFSGSKPLWGPFKVNPDTWTAWIEEDKIQFSGGMGMPGPNVISLDCGEDGVQLNTEKPTDFYIYLPAGEFGENDLKVNIYNVDGAEYSAAAEKAVTVERNCVYPFEWNVVFENGSSVNPVVAPDGALSSHVFTVGDGPADKVYFSKGNLRAYHNNEGYTWGFADNQYDIVGSGQFDINAEIFDLFCWSTTSNQYGIIRKDVINEEFVDWGNNIDNGDWHTLTGGTNGEWNYLLTKRVVNGGTGAEHAYSWLRNTTVCGRIISGLFIFPDGFTYQNIWRENYTTWTELADAGIVFLPETGFQTYYGDEAWISGGGYWSSSAYDYAYALGIFFHNAIYTEDGAREPKKAKCSVRLVSNAFVLAPPAPPATDVVVVEEQSVDSGE